MTGTFTGRDERGGELLEWSGTATFSRITEGPEGASILKLVSGEATITASGVAPTDAARRAQIMCPCSPNRRSVSSEKEHQGSCTTSTCRSPILGG